MPRARLDTVICFEPKQRDVLGKILRAVPQVIELDENEATELEWLITELKKE